MRHRKRQTCDSRFEAAEHSRRLASDKSGRFDFDFLHRFLGLCRLRQGDGQHPFREIGGDLVTIDASRQLECPLERAIGALREMVVLVPLFLLLALLRTSMSPDTDTSTSLASIPGNSAEILYAFSSSLMSIAGVEKLNELRHAGSISNIRRSDGKPNPLPNRSNSRSISLRKDCHTSGRVVCAGGAFFTSTGTSAIAVSIGRWKGNASILAMSIGGTLI
jgi:hypothetical protein